MKKNGFVVSAILYPLLVLFLAIVMGLLAMSDTRKRILDKMKLEISDSIFDEATCSCDTILNKLNYLIKNGTGGGGGGSYAQNVLSLNVKKYETPAGMPNINNHIGDIAVITQSGLTDQFRYYVSQIKPSSPKDGDVWIIQDIRSPYYIMSDYSRIGINYAMEYLNGKWNLLKSYVYDNGNWKQLYYVPVQNGVVDLNGTDMNAEVKKTYTYSGKYEEFRAIFSGYYQIELWGAQGGNFNGYGGGKGAYTRGKIYLQAGDILYVYVGGQNGWNGGGASSSYGAVGGGATDIRVVPTTQTSITQEELSLRSRIMVAGAGGGGSYYSVMNCGIGGNAGGLTSYIATGLCGDTSSAVRYGSVATQTLGGNNASFGIGGNYSGNGAGGGSGWYGGGGARNTSWGGPGAGGTSYISGHVGCDSININGIHTGSSYSYTNYYFVETLMIDGSGYQWTNYRENLVNMPKTDGNGSMVGNSGNGYAQIMLETVEEISSEAITQKRKEADKESNFTYKNQVQIFTVPKTGKYQVELWGAQGGDYSSYAGGKGAYTSGVISLKEGTELYVYVGGKASTFNGGGGASSYGSNGGGATDLRTVRATSDNVWNDAASLRSRIMVAGAGGGGSYYSGMNCGIGGNAGGLTSYIATGLCGDTSGATRYGSTASQTAGGNNASFGVGGNYSDNGAGGGSGWYGGGGARNTSWGGPGAGGTSYISGHNGCIGVTASGTVATNSVSHTGYQFTNTDMIDGGGKRWTSVAGSVIGMPSWNSNTTINGNTGEGHARITYLSS